MQDQVEQVDRISPSRQAILEKNHRLKVVLGRDEQGGGIAFELATLPRKFARAEGIGLPDECNEEPCEARAQAAERPLRTLWRPSGIKRTKT